LRLPLAKKRNGHQGAKAQSNTRKNDANLVNLGDLVSWWQKEKNRATKAQSRKGNTRKIK